MPLYTTLPGDLAALDTQGMGEGMPIWRRFAACFPPFGIRMSASCWIRCHLRAAMPPCPPVLLPAGTLDSPRGPRIKEIC